MLHRPNQGFNVKIHKIASDISGITFPQLTGSDGEDDPDEDLTNRIANGNEGDDDDEDDGVEDDNDDDDEEAKQDKKLAREAARRRRENNKLKKELQQLKEEQEQQALSRKSKLEQAQHKLNEAKATNDSLSSTNQRLLLEMAVLKDSKRTWHDSSAVIALLDTSEVEIDPESGNIEGIEEALADLAKDKPFLLRTGGSRQGNGASGSQPQSGGNGSKKTKQQREAELAKKWKLG